MRFSTLFALLLSFTFSLLATPVHARKPRRDKVASVILNPSGGSMRPGDTARMPTAGGATEVVTRNVFRVSATGGLAVRNPLPRRTGAEKLPHQSPDAVAAFPRESPPAPPPGRAGKGAWKGAATHSSLPGVQPILAGVSRKSRAGLVHHFDPLRVCRPRTSVPRASRPREESDNACSNCSIDFICPTPRRGGSEQCVTGSGSSFDSTIHRVTFQ